MLDTQSKGYYEWKVLLLEGRLHEAKRQRDNLQKRLEEIEQLYKESLENFKKSILTR